MDWKSLGIGIFFLGLFISCSTSKTAEGTRVRAGKSDAMTLYRDMTDLTEYRWYTGKARFRATLPDARMSATVYIRMVRDSVIWATVDKFGLEVARVLITPDSVTIVDRLNREVTEKPLDAFLAEYGVQIGFSDLQNALIGRMIALIPDHVTAQHQPQFDILEIRDNIGVMAKHWLTNTLPRRLLKSQFTDAQGRMLQVENTNWERLSDGNEVPFTRLLDFEDGDGTTEIEINFSEIAINVPASLPFSIPGHYAKAR